MKPAQQALCKVLTVLEFAVKGFFFPHQSWVKHLLLKSFQIKIRNKVCIAGSYLSLVALNLDKTDSLHVTVDQILITVKLDLFLIICIIYICTVIHSDFLSSTLKQLKVLISK